MHSLWSRAFRILTVVGFVAINCGFAPVTVDTRKPVPAGAILTSTKKIIQETFKDDLAAKKPADRAAAGRMLRKQAEGDTSPSGYVMLRLSAQLFMEAGDFDSAFADADAIAAAFVAKAPDVKVELIEELARDKTVSPDPNRLAVAASTVAQEALDSGALDAAAKASTAATAAGRKSRDPDVAACVKAAAKAVEQAKLDERAAQSAVKALLANPDDPKANLQSGRYLCFWKGEWNEGLSRLAKSNDAALKPIVEQEQRLIDQESPDGKAMAALGDAWWNLSAAKNAPIAEAQCRRRAAYWYQRALPALAGLQRKSAEQRIQQAQAGAESESRIALKSLIGSPPDRVQMTADGLVLRGASATSAEELTVPVRIDVIAKTDSRNIRLNFGKAGEVIFDWERNPQELRYHDPASGAQSGVPDQGYIKPGEWAAITWIVEEKRATIIVDGKQRAVFNGDYRNLHSKATIYTDSTVTVRSWKFSTISGKK